VARAQARSRGIPDATVSEVAYACGFKTVPHFTRKFKARFGTTPAAYRGSSGE